MLVLVVVLVLLLLLLTVLSSSGLLVVSDSTVVAFASAFCILGAVADAQRVGVVRKRGKLLFLALLVLPCLLQLALAAAAGWSLSGRAPKTCGARARPQEEVDAWFLSAALGAIGLALVTFTAFVLGFAAAAALERAAWLQRACCVAVGALLARGRALPCSLCSTVFGMVPRGQSGNLYVPGDCCGMVARSKLRLLELWKLCAGLLPGLQAEEEALDPALLVILLLPPFALCCLLYLIYQAIDDGESGPKRSAKVVRIMRYPVKGLDFSCQSLGKAHLVIGLSLKHDRVWGLQSGTAPEGMEGQDFDADAPLWIHKARFACAFSKGPELAQLECEWDEEKEALAVFAKRSVSVSQDPAQDDKRPADRTVLLPMTPLRTEVGAAAAELFFRKRLNDKKLSLVTASLKLWRAGPSGGVHQFSNTQFISAKPNGTAAEKAEHAKEKVAGGALTIHIINLATVRALSAAAGVEIDWRRFRPNLLLAGDELPAWAENKWVGKEIVCGGATLRVTKRTVRCDATKTNPTTAEADLDVPQLLKEHSPTKDEYIGVYAVVVKDGDVGDGDVVGDDGGD